MNKSATSQNTPVTTIRISEWKVENWLKFDILKGHNSHVPGSM